MENDIVRLVNLVGTKFNESEACKAMVDEEAEAIVSNTGNKEHSDIYGWLAVWHVYYNTEPKKESYSILVDNESIVRYIEVF